MKICILGASGGVGKQLVDLALKRGHAVTAVVRPSSQVSFPAQVKVVRGNLTEVAFLRSAVAGQDGVLSGLGPKIQGLGIWNLPEEPHFMEKSSRALVEALKAESVTRLVAISSGGVGDSASQVPKFFRLFAKVTALRHAFQELEQMERLFSGSGLEVCVVRPPGLTNGPLTGKAQVVSGFAGRSSLSRADVADFMLKCLESPINGSRTPLIGAAA